MLANDIRIIFVLLRSSRTAQVDYIKRSFSWIVDRNATQSARHPTCNCSLVYMQTSGQADFDFPTPNTATGFPFLAPFSTATIHHPRWVIGWKLGGWVVPEVMVYGFMGLPDQT